MSSGFNPESADRRSPSIECASQLRDPNGRRPRTTPDRLGSSGPNATRVWWLGYHPRRQSRLAEPPT